MLGKGRAEYARCISSDIVYIIFIRTSMQGLHTSCATIGILVFERKVPAYLAFQDSCYARGGSYSLHNDEHAEQVDRRYQRTHLLYYGRNQVTYNP